jgi:5-formyltetrahydrofolate cyclo-ligase
LPREIIQRFTGTVMTKETTRKPSRLAQNRMSARPASRAPGITMMVALSTAPSRHGYRVGGQGHADRAAQT